MTLYSKFSFVFWNILIPNTEMSAASPAANPKQGRDRSEDASKIARLCHLLGSFPNEGVHSRT
jgi:hypothetical protein